MVTGIIYKLVCNETNTVYYGSTTCSLNRRICGHKSGCKEWKAGKRHYTTSYSIIEKGNYSYSLIETVECEDKKQLETRERYYIENNECVNKYIPTRTNKEYSDANKDKAKEYKEANREAINEQRKKVYKQANKEAINEQRKEYYEANKDAINVRNNAYYEANKEKIKERQRQRRAELKRLKENN